MLAGQTKWQLQVNGGVARLVYADKDVVTVFYSGPVTRPDKAIDPSDQTYVRARIVTAHARFNNVFYCSYEGRLRAKR